MLKSVWRMTVCLLLSVGLLTASASFATADDPGGEVNPCAARDICVVVTDPGGTPAPGETHGGSGGGDDGGVQMCSWNGKQWPCWDDDLGWFSTSDGCYYHRSDPQPPASDSAWAGHDPSTGAIYEVNCRGVGGQLTPKPPMFFAQAPGGAPPPDRPADLARKALKMIHFDPPTLHAAPAGTALVGSPVWLWYDAKPTTSGEQSATAKGRQFGVTATATLSEVKWDTGDGSVFSCKDAGTPYRPELPRDAVPSCGHTYRTSSAKADGQAFYVTATLVWQVKAVRTDTGATVTSFRLLVTTDVPLKLPVAEVQLLG